MWIVELTYSHQWDNYNFYFTIYWQWETENGDFQNFAKTFFSNLDNGITFNRKRCFSLSKNDSNKGYIYIKQISFYKSIMVRLTVSNKVNSASNFPYPINDLLILKRRPEERRDKYTNNAYKFIIFPLFFAFFFSIPSLHVIYFPRPSICWFFLNYKLTRLKPCRSQRSTNAQWTRGLRSE